MDGGRFPPSHFKQPSPSFVSIYPSIYQPSVSGSEKEVVLQLFGRLATALITSTSIPHASNLYHCYCHPTAGIIVEKSYDDSQLIKFQPKMHPLDRFLWWVLTREQRERGSPAAWDQPPRRSSFRQVPTTPYSTTPLLIYGMVQPTESIQGSQISCQLPCQRLSRVDSEA